MGEPQEQKVCDVCGKPATRYCEMPREPYGVCGKPLCDEHKFCKRCKND